MKTHRHLTAAFCFLSIGAIAQPVLTRDNCVPVVGTIYEIGSLNTSSIFPGPSGANVTWDFSSAQNGSFSDTLTYGEISSSSYAGLYPGANLVQYSSGSPSEYFFFAESTVYERLGNQLAPGYSYYSDAMSTLSFPFTFADAFVDTYEATGDNTQVSYVLTGTDSTEADAYGTLLLSNGIVLNDVLRIKTKRNAVRDEGNSNLLIEAVIYSWYKPGIRDAVLEYTEASFNGGPVSPSAWVQSASSILAIPEKQLLSTSVFPNPIPSAGKIIVETKGRKTAYFFDVNGKKVLEPIEFTENELLLNRNDFKPGIYFYTIQDETGSTAQGKVVFI